VPSKTDSGDMKKTQPSSVPDHGRAYVPGAGQNMAPQSLDHFKRGYKERAAMRDRAFCDHRGDHNASPQGGPTRTRHNGNGHGDAWASRGPPQAMIMGVNILHLVDCLSNPRNNCEQELDKLYEKHEDFFVCGKGSTAILTAAARQRNVRLAETFWVWMDHRKLEKNTFHYNSMISVCEKGKNYRKTLDLLKEMTDRKIAKNEVT